MSISHTVHAGNVTFNLRFLHVLDHTFFHAFLEIQPEVIDWGAVVIAMTSVLYWKCHLQYEISASLVLSLNSGHSMN